MLKSNSMYIAKTLVLAGLLLLGGGVRVGFAVDGPEPLEASIAPAKESHAGDAVHLFAMACGLLAFAAAAQQALASRRPAVQRVKTDKD